MIREPEGRMAGLLGEAAGMALPIVAAAKAPQIAQGLLQMGENMRAPTPMNAATRWQAGAIVYHGSPHKFDKFDSSKIGTGEGSQAQGHGLYFAENKAVADEYRKALSDGLGHTYKVDLPDAEIAKMIDWDKPWSQQSESVRKAINTDALERFYNTKDLPASQVLFHLNQGRAPADSAAYLQSIGVPGVKYLDQGSRSAGGETRNFVVFPGNEGLLKILGRE